MIEKWVLLLRYDVVACILLGKYEKKVPEKESKPCLSLKEIQDLYCSFCHDPQKLCQIWLFLARNDA